MLQLYQLEMIEQFVKICEQEHLMYYMLGGTMLGAVRHKGYIPWDDDTDFGMPRPDYEKFLLVAREYLPANMIIEEGGKTKKYPYYFSRISCVEKKVVVRIGNETHIENTWIDIFPLDGMPNYKLTREFHALRLLVRRAVFKFAWFDESVNVSKTKRPWHERFLIFLGKHLPIEKFLSKEKEQKKLDQALKKYPYEQSNYLINLMGGYKLREMFHKDVFGEGAFYDFEGMKLRGPSNYDFYLTQLYGDYMTPPPESERNRHNTAFIEDCDT